MACLHSLFQFMIQVPALNRGCSPHQASPASHPPPRVPPWLPTRNSYMWPSFFMVLLSLWAAHRNPRGPTQDLDGADKQQMCLFLILFWLPWLPGLAALLSFLETFSLFFFKLFILYWCIVYVVVVSGVQQKDSAICMYPFSPKPHSYPGCHIILSCMCYTCPCWLPSLNIVVCTCPSQTPYPCLPGNCKFIF